MSTPAQFAANAANAKLAHGPATEAGKAASSKNALKSGLFTSNDFIRPDEQPLHADLHLRLQTELAPEGILEEALVSEIRRSLWRLRRCGELEADFSRVPDPSAALPDPMQNESNALLQNSIDRARAHSHRVFHRCTAELRKLQTERHFRAEYFTKGTDTTSLGLCDAGSLDRSLTASRLRQIQLDEHDRMAEIFENNRQYVDHVSAAQSTGAPAAAPPASPATPHEMAAAPPPVAHEMPAAKRNQIPRSAPCPCGSGLKFKRCCGKNAAPVLGERPRATAA